MKKLCPKCRFTKEADAFAKALGRADGLQSVCRECKKEIQRTYYHANKESYKSKIYQSRQVRKSRSRQFVINYMKQHPCVDCGEQDVHVLEFDHVRGVKINGVGKMVHEGASIENIVAEIDKCEVRCCNCHRKVTLSRAGIDFTEYI